MNYSCGGDYGWVALGVDPTGWMSGWKLSVGVIHSS